MREFHIAATLFKELNTFLASTSNRPHPSAWCSSNSFLNAWTAPSMHGLLPQCMDSSLNAWTAPSMHGLLPQCMDCSLNAWTAPSMHGLLPQCMDCSLNAWTAPSMHGLLPQCMDCSLNAWTAPSMHGLLPQMPPLSPEHNWSTSHKSAMSSQVAMAISLQRMHLGELTNCNRPDTWAFIKRH